MQYTFLMCLLLFLPFLCRGQRNPFVKTPKVRVQGREFLVEGKEFISVGIAYQPGGSAKASEGYDPIADENRVNWERDLRVIHSLGVNTVRVYDV